jgi:hypothetical protein
VCDVRIVTKRQSHSRAKATRTCSKKPNKSEKELVDRGRETAEMDAECEERGARKWCWIERLRTRKSVTKNYDRFGNAFELDSEPDEQMRMKSGNHTFCSGREDSRRGGGRRRKVGGGRQVRNQIESHDPKEEEEEEEDGSEDEENVPRYYNNVAN